MFPTSRTSRAAASLTRRALLGAALVVTFGGVAASTARADDAPAPAPLPVSVPMTLNTTCPIMGKPASKAMFADTENGRIYVCCPPCVAKILKDPKRAYETAYPVTKKLGNTVCPVTDKPLGADAVTVVLQGYEIGVCATCAAQAREHHQVTLAKALDPKLTEVKNGTCPVTGQPVAKNVIVTIGTEIVHLASPKAVDEVKKDPAKHLQKAKEIAARESAAAASAGVAPAAGSTR